MSTPKLQLHKDIVFKEDIEKLSDTVAEVENNIENLAPVAKTGSYSDLIDTPDVYTKIESNTTFETKSDAEAKLTEAKNHTDSCDRRITVSGGFVTMINIATQDRAELFSSAPCTIKRYDEVVCYVHNTASMVLTGGTGIADSNHVNLAWAIYGENKAIKTNIISDQRVSQTHQTIFTVDEPGTSITMRVHGEYDDQRTIYCNFQPNVEYQLLYNVSCGTIYTDVSYGECFNGSANNITIVKNDSKYASSIGNKMTLNYSTLPYSTAVFIPTDMSSGVTLTAKYQSFDTSELMTSLSFIKGYNNDDVPSPFPVTNIQKKTICWDGTIATAFSSTASGTEVDPIIINTASELAYLVSKATDTTGKYYKIADDIGAIVLQSSEKASKFMELGSAWHAKKYYENNGDDCYIWCGNTSHTFSGHFDGNGVTIYGLYIKESSYCGLFGAIGANTTIENLTIKWAYLRTGWYAGAIAGNIAASDGDNDKVVIKKCVIDGCCIIGKYISDTDKGVKIIPNHCIGLMIGGSDYADTTNISNISITNCLAYIGKISYEYDNSEHNYLVGYSKNIAIKDSVLFGCDGIACIGATTESADVYTISGNGIAGKYRGERVIKTMPNLTWGINWFPTTKYSERAVPFDFLQLAQGSLLKRIQNNTDICNGILNNIKITSLLTTEKYTFDWNAMYLIKSNSGNVDITLYNSDTGSVVVDGDGNNMPALSLCLIILPKETIGESDRRCMCIGMTGNFSIINPNVVISRQFNVASGDVYFTPPKSASVFKIAL